MKSTFEVTLTTSKMSKCYNGDSPDEWTKKNEITEQVEAEIHKEFERVLDKGDLLDSLAQRVTEGEMTNVEGWEELTDYGTFKITVKKVAR